VPQGFISCEKEVKGNPTIVNKETKSSVTFLFMQIDLWFGQFLVWYVEGNGNCKLCLLNPASGKKFQAMLMKC